MTLRKITPAEAARRIAHPEEPHMLPPKTVITDHDYWMVVAGGRPAEKLDAMTATMCKCSEASQQELLGIKATMQAIVDPELRLKELANINRRMYGRYALSLLIQRLAYPDDVITQADTSEIDPKHDIVIVYDELAEPPINQVLTRREVVNTRLLTDEPFGESDSSEWYEDSMTHLITHIQTIQTENESADAAPYNLQLQAFIGREALQ
jgi:hypothetical protein